MQKISFKPHSPAEITTRFIMNPRWGFKFFFQLYLIKKSGTFNGEYYNSQFEDGVKIRRSMFHYVYYSKYVQTDPSPYFDTEYYLSQRTFLKKLITDFSVTPLYHYLMHGYKDKLNPNPDFNTWAYLRDYRDVYLSGQHPLAHYIYAGKSEGRRGGSKIPVVEAHNWLWNKNFITRIFVSAMTNDFADTVDYMKWRKKYNPSVKELEQQREHSFSIQPKISIIVPVYNPEPKFIREAILSVIKQTYSNWELCISDCSTDIKVKKVIERFAAKDHRVRYVFSSKRMHISDNSNTALKIASGDYMGLLDHDDLLSENALFEVVKYIEDNPQADIIYSDEDKISEDSKTFFDPFFKPDWSPDSLLSHNYTCHFTVYRKELLDEAGWFRNSFDGSQDYDLMLRASEFTGNIGHVSKVLYHWRSHSNSAAGKVDAKSYAFDAAKRAKEEALDRRGTPGKLVPCEQSPGQYGIDYEIQGNPLVSIIIPTHDKKELLKGCINSIRHKTAYSNYEIIVVDNNSSKDETRAYLKTISKDTDVSVYEYHKPFNYSEINNFAVSKEKGDFLLFMNNDIEVLTENWLIKMLGHAQREYTGAVGAQLLFPETMNIQHCGVLNLYGGPTHAFFNMYSDKSYSFERNIMDKNWIGVTGACLLISKKKFLQVNGFDEELAVTYNDVDLCMKLVKAGYYNVCRNSVKLLHYESATRGNDFHHEEKTSRLEQELSYLNSKHPEFHGNDPFYNNNLTQYKIDFDLKPL